MKTISKILLTITLFFTLAAPAFAKPSLPGEEQLLKEVVLLKEEISTLEAKQVQNEEKSPAILLSGIAILFSGISLAFIVFVIPIILRKMTRATFPESRNNLPSSGSFPPPL